MDLYAFNPGPLDESVLYDQEKHVSSAVWEGQVKGYSEIFEILFGEKIMNLT